MPKPIVIAYHLIWTAYGWWLPNDPRGSGSKTIRNPMLAHLGTLHHGRKKTQPASGTVRTFYDHAIPLLRHELLTLNEKDRTTAAYGLATAINTHRYTCYAAAIMPDHVHLIIRRHKHSAEEIIENLQSSSRDQMTAAGRHSSDHPVWTRGGWKRFLDRPAQVSSVIQYVNQNPLELGLSAQQWSFVKPYDNWPFHKGHNPNSPYFQRLRTR
jgi:REP element-mobilizing transposase RayT